MRQSLGTAVFFGMLGVTVFGLIFTPVFYTVMRKFARKRQPPQPVATAPTPRPLRRNNAQFETSNRNPSPPSTTPNVASSPRRRRR